MKTSLFLPFLLLASAVPALAFKSGSQLSNQNDPNAGYETTDSFGLGDLIPRAFAKNPRINLTVITEMTAAGRLVIPATPAHPVYYVLVDGGIMEEGDAIAGERPPQISSLEAQLTKSLRTNGYLPAVAAHPASLVIYIRWGSFNALSVNLAAGVAASGDTSVDASTAANPDDLQQQNFLERVAIVGGTQFAVEVGRAMNAGTLDLIKDRDQKINLLLTQASDNLYFVIATAYDAASVAKGGKTILWRTKMSTNSQGVEMDEVLPVLLDGAAPFFGREMKSAKPLGLRLSDDGSVKIGDVTVQAYIPVPNPPPANQPPTPPAPPATKP